MNCGSIKSVNPTLIKRYPLPTEKGRARFFAYLRAFLPTRKPTTNIRVESLHAELHLPRFSVLLWPIGEDCLLLAQCSRGTLFPAELAEIILHPLVFEGQSRKCIAKCQPLEAGAYISVLSIVEIVSEDGFIVIELIIIWWYQPDENTEWKKSRPIRNLYNKRFLISEISLKSLKFKFVKWLVQCTLIVIIEAIRNISFRYSVRYFHDKS